MLKRDILFCHLFTGELFLQVKMTHTIHPKPFIYFSNVMNVMMFSNLFPRYNCYSWVIVISVVKLYRASVADLCRDSVVTYHCDKLCRTSVTVLWRTIVTRLCRTSVTVLWRTIVTRLCVMVWQGSVVPMWQWCDVPLWQDYVVTVWQNCDVLVWQGCDAPVWQNCDVPVWQNCDVPWPVRQGFDVPVWQCCDVPVWQGSYVPVWPGCSKSDLLHSVFTVIS